MVAPLCRSALEIKPAAVQGPRLPVPHNNPGGLLSPKKLHRRLVWVITYVQVYFAKGCVRSASIYGLTPTPNRLKLQEVSDVIIAAEP
jgi:hypothetical protein